MSTLAEAIDLGSVGFIRGGLLANAYPLPDGWENGIAFLGTGCAEPQISAPCTITDRTEVRPGDASVFEPIFIEQSSACSMLSKIGNVDIAANRLDATTEWALGRALASGSGSTNPALFDGESVSTGSDVVAAISCIEQAAADVGFGAEVFLHAPLRAAAFLAEKSQIIDGMFSPSGFRWIFSPGYPADANSVTIWATGSVFASVSPAETLVDGVTGLPPVGWRQNTGAAYRQRIGLAAFDPCLNLSATFTVPACTGGS